MESISVKVLNEILSEKSREKYFLNEKKGHTGVPDNGEGNQGEFNETFRYFRHPEMPENTFLEVTMHTDSYGDEDEIKEMKFVQGVQKQITVYEPIK